MRTKFTVVFNATWRYDSKEIKRETGEPYFKRGEVAFNDKYYYLGNNISDCLTAFWNYVLKHRFVCPPFGLRNEAKKITILEVLREEVPDTYSCGKVDGLCGGELVVTQNIDGRVFRLWNPRVAKTYTIFLDKSWDFTDDGGYCKAHYGEGMEHIRIGDIIDCTCEQNSLMTDICTFFNVTGKSDLTLAKQMTATHEYPEKDKFVTTYMERLYKEGNKTIVLDAFGLHKYVRDAAYCFHEEEMEVKEHDAFMEELESHMWHPCK